MWPARACIQLRSQMKPTNIVEPHKIMQLQIRTRWSDLHDPASSWYSINKFKWPKNIAGLEKPSSWPTGMLRTANRSGTSCSQFRTGTARSGRAGTLKLPKKTIIFNYLNMRRWPTALISLFIAYVFFLSVISLAMELLCSTWLSISYCRSSIIDTWSGFCDFSDGWSKGVS